MNKIFQENYEELFDTDESLDSLWELLLNLGVRGKLVPQDPRDEPARVLVDKIKAEKKVKNSKKLKRIIDTETPFNIPEKWEWVRLGEIANFTIGKTPPSKNPVYWDLEKGIPWVSIADMPLQGLIESTSKRVTIDAKEKIFKREPVVTDVLLMSFKLTIGKVALTKFPVFHNEAIISFEDIYSIELRNFLFWTLPLLSNLGKKKGAIKGKTLNSASISNLLIPIPPISEKVKIVKKLVELKEKIDLAKDKVNARNSNRMQLSKSSLENLNSKNDWKFVEKNFDTIIESKQDVDNLRKTILNLAIRGKLVPQDLKDEPASVLLEKIQAEKEKLVKEKKIRKEKPLPEIKENEIPFQIPESWEWSMIGEFTTQTGSGSTPRGGKSVYVSQGIPFLRSQNVHNNGLDLDDVAYITSETNKKMKHTQVMPGDLLLNITGGSMGRVALVPKDFETGNISQHVAIIRTTEYSNSSYLHIALLSSYFQDLILEYTTGSGRLGLQKNRMVTMKLPIPPLLEQVRIVQKVDQLMRLCDRIEIQIEERDKTSKKLVDAILKQV